VPIRWHARPRSVREQAAEPAAEKIPAQRVDFRDPGRGLMLTREIHHGPCEERLQNLETGSCHAMVTDPPAGINFLGIGWDTDRGGRDKWIAWAAGIFVQCKRVLVPGANVIVWAFPDLRFEIEQGRAIKIYVPLSWIRDHREERQAGDPAVDHAGPQGVIGRSLMCGS